MKHPTKFLSVLNYLEGEAVFGLTACAGFELGEWRAKRLAEHLLNWLPNFALRPSEMDEIGAENVYDLMKRAAVRVYETKFPEKRGEIGELLLHIIGITEYKAHAFVSRLYYKMRTNDQITGFDSALVTINDTGTDVELWLGEAKFYTDPKAALNAAIESIAGHLDAGFLRETKILVGPKIEPQTPGFEKLQWLFDDNNKLDELLSRIVVPVLIAAESKSAQAYKDDTTYSKLVIEEYEILTSSLIASGLADKVKLALIYVPLGSKSGLIKEFDEKLGAFK